jgi:hypothetical protein
MGLDELLGLLFLFFFIVLPALQGLLRRGQRMPPDFEPEEILLPGEERTPPAQQPQPRPAPRGGPAGPSPTSMGPARPPASTPPPRPLVSQPSAQPPRPKTPAGQRPKALVELERERLSRAGSRPVQQEPARPVPARPAPPATTSRTKPAEQWELSITPHAILNGVVWHQVLAEPRSQHWRRVRKTK